MDDARRVIVRIRLEKCADIWRFIYARLVRFLTRIPIEVTSP